MITQRSASARFLVIISTIAAVLVLLLATAVHAFTGSGTIDTVDYEVHAGDSVWSIAEGIAGEGVDVRSVVSAIRDLNELAEPVIYPGDLLEIPTRP